MVERYGGSWTEQKLVRLGKYLAAYRTIFARNPKARYFMTWYVDAFAGTGQRSVKQEPLGSLFEDIYCDAEAQSYRDGSAAIALGLSSPFDQYLFIEKSRRRIDSLRNLISDKHASLEKRCVFEQADANASLQAWAASRDWRKERAVVFLDPYGLQVDWTTVVALAKTGGVDLWYLFPLGVGVVRMLTRDGKIDPTWEARLDALFGTHAWHEKFYRTGKQLSLYGEDTIVREASEQEIIEFIEGRLKSVFPKIAKSLVLRNSKKNPLFLLCFCASNVKAAGVAIKIAEDILKD